MTTPQQLKTQYLAELQVPNATGRSLPELHMGIRQLESASESEEVHFPDMGQYMVWSDLHFGHKNIIDYANRPFNDVAEMNAALFKNWAGAVAENQTVLFIGDVAMKDALNEATWSAIRGAPGVEKWLVLGNHDVTGSGRLRTPCFDRVMGSIYTAAQDLQLFFSHVPLKTVPPGYVNIHGHDHNSPCTQTRHINVSVEHLEYTPISLLSLFTLAQSLVQERYPEGATTLERIRNLGVPD